MGVKFSAACTLDCTEYPEGVPTALCSTSGDGSDGLLPHPRTSAPGLPARDISFVLVEGDFKVGWGAWARVGLLQGVGAVGGASPGMRAVGWGMPGEGDLKVCSLGLFRCVPRAEGMATQA